MISLHNALGELTVILEKCERYKSDHSKDETLAARMGLVLKYCGALDVGRCGRVMRDRVFKVITSITNVVNTQLHISKDKAIRIGNLLLDVVFKMEERPLRTPTTGILQPRIIETQCKLADAFKPKPAHHIKIDCSIAYFCDIDHSDWNGAILSGICDVLENPMPFITSLSLLNGSLMTIKNYSQIIRVKKLLNCQKEEWDVYLQIEEENGGELVVFLPKQGLPAKTDEEILAALDLRCDGTLQKISVNKAMRGHNGKPTFEAFTRLFREDPKRSKLFYLDGHGGIGAPGGMSKEVFEKFLLFLEKQLCKGMAITSCYSGGQTTLNFLSNQKDLKKKVLFPVMLQSLGDFASYNGQEAEFSMKDRLAMMQSLIEVPGGLTYKKWKKALIECEKGKTKCLQNQVQLYFPSTNSPSGFRPLEELPNTYSLTMTKLGRAFHEPEKGIELIDINLFAVFPLVVNCPITFYGKLPLLISQFPGASHHYFSHISVKEEEADGIIIPWMDDMLEIYEDVRVRKAFFIEKLEGLTECLDHLVVYIGINYTECF